MWGLSWAIQNPDAPAGSSVLSEIPFFQRQLYKQKGAHCRRLISKRVFCNKTSAKPLIRWAQSIQVFSSMSNCFHHLIFIFLCNVLGFLRGVGGGWGGCNLIIQASKTYPLNQIYIYISISPFHLVHHHFGGRGWNQMRLHLEERVTCQVNKLHQWIIRTYNKMPEFHQLHSNWK